jgi:SAM-dependent methyltransferase
MALWTLHGGRAGAPPLAVYAAALRRSTAGVRTQLTAVDPAGQVRAVPTADWCGGIRGGDYGVLERCTASTLDVGCGPGRLAGSLARRGLAALGIDVSAAAVRLARRRGVPVLRRDVFAPLPREGHWRRVLLVDGNIGIDGDPERLLHRCRALAAPAGRLLVEVDPPGFPSWSGELRIRVDNDALSAPFRWAYVGADDLARLASAAGLRILEHWTEAGRWFASLSRD